MPGSRQACPNSAACWSPAMPDTGMPAGTPVPGAVTPKRPLDGRTSGRERERHPEEVEQLVRPGERADVEQHRAAGVRRLGGEHAPVDPAREVPQHPGVDGAERQVGRDRHAALGQQPLDLGGREVRVEHETGGGAHQRFERRRLGSSSQRAAVRRSCHTMARWTGWPVRRSHATTVSRWSVIPMAAMGSVEPARPARRGWPGRRPRSPRRRAPPSRAAGSAA